MSLKESRIFDFIEINPSIFQDVIIQILEDIRSFIHKIFPVTLTLAIFMVNLSFIIGAILYLLDYDELNGKKMLFRSAILSILLFFVFNVYTFTELEEPFQGFEKFASFITAYLLFIFAALSLILFLGNLGYYLLSPNPSQKRILKKTLFCLLCTFIPLGLQFPAMPKWVI